MNNETLEKELALYLDHLNLFEYFKVLEIYRDWYYDYNDGNILDHDKKHKIIKSWEEITYLSNNTKFTILFRIKYPLESYNWRLINTANDNDNRYRVKVLALESIIVTGCIAYRPNTILANLKLDYSEYSLEMGDTFRVGYSSSIRMEE